MSAQDSLPSQPLRPPLAINFVINGSTYPWREEALAALQLLDPDLAHELASPDPSSYPSPMPPDPFNLARFVEAQAPVWDDVQAELARASKRTHWMWFVFPQLVALGRSATARHYGISGADEALAYLRHPVLGPRLLACCDLLLESPPGVSARDIFGEVDVVKLRSCLTLFDRVAPGTPAFGACLDRFFAGQRDPLTLDLLP